MLRVLLVLLAMSLSSDCTGSSLSPTSSLTYGSPNGSWDGPLSIMALEPNRFEVRTTNTFIEAVYVPPLRGMLRCRSWPLMGMSGEDLPGKSQHPAIHTNGCKPCAWYRRNTGCSSGSTCQYCHHEDHKRDWQEAKRLRSRARKSKCQRFRSKR